MRKSYVENLAENHAAAAVALADVSPFSIGAISPSSSSPSSTGSGFRGVGLALRRLIISFGGVGGDSSSILLLGGDSRKSRFKASIEPDPTDPAIATSLSRMPSIAPSANFRIKNVICELKYDVKDSLFVLIIC